MKKYLILVKHSLPEIIQNLPAHAWKLSDEGRVRSERLAHQLMSYQPEVIVSSNEPKASETAQIIARSHQLECEVVKGLHEHDRSNVPYLSQTDFQASIDKFFQKPDALVFGRESADQAHRRFSRAVQSVLKSHPNETIVVVAHGTVISLFVSRLTGSSDLLLWKELGLPSFVVIDLESNTLITKENTI